MSTPKYAATKITFDTSALRKSTDPPEVETASATVGPLTPPEKFSTVADGAVAVVALSPVPVVSASAASPIPNRHPSSQFAWIEAYVLSKKHGKAYVVTSSKGFKEVLAIGGSDLNARIRAHYRSLHGEPLKQRDLKDLNEELLSEAEEYGMQLDLYPRVRPLDDGGVEVDLNDGLGTTVRLTADGVKVSRGDSQGLFIRSPSALSLPVPADQGDYTLLREYVNLEPHAFLLYIAWVTFTIGNPKIEATKYLFLVLKARQGSGKTFASKTTQRLVDPNAVGVQTLPGAARELAIIQQSVHLMVVDNLRDLTPAMSDALCIAATGGSVPMRKLYTDDEQKALFLHGAIVFNGIHPFVGQSDLADRCLVLDLGPLPPEKLKSETEMLERFGRDYPVILRGLYDLISKVFRALPDAQITHPARMLDFCKWLAAMEVALDLNSGTLQQKYVQSLKDAQLESLIDNPLAVTIIHFAEEMPKSQWKGTPTKFYEKLTALAGFTAQRSRAWPPTAASLSKRLHGLQAPLAAQGIFIELERGKDRQIVVERSPSVTVRLPPASSPMRFEGASTPAVGDAGKTAEKVLELDRLAAFARALDDARGGVADTGEGQPRQAADDSEY